MTTDRAYTTRLQAGLGLLTETQQLLTIWSEGMSVSELSETALKSGAFPNITSRRLRNIIVEGFRPRYLVDDDYPAKHLKKLMECLNTRDFTQLLFLFTCRVNLILADFVHAVYWNAYSAGKAEISNEDARDFVIRANERGKTTHPWSESTILRVARYLTGSCADFGLLEGSAKSVRRILPYRATEKTVVFLAYDLHFSGLGDNQVLSHPDWELFGLNRYDVLDELKRLALKDWFIIQVAGGAVRIGWRYESMEEMVDALTQ